MDNRTKQTRVCDPALCSHCEYIGEGDFICDRFPNSEGNPITIVMSDWGPTESYMRCQGEASVFEAMKQSGYTVDELIKCAGMLVKAMPPISEDEITLIKLNPSLSWLQKWRLIRYIKKNIKKQR